jgi:predicted metal-dependent peptidase
MVEFAPSTGGLALWMRHVDLPDARPPGDAAAHSAPAGGALQAALTAPVIATDGNAIYYGAGFVSLSLAEQTARVAHEVLHVALRHPQRYLALEQLLGDVDLQLYTVCADAIVNSALGHLRWLALPNDAVLLERILAQALNIHTNAEKSLLEWDVERLYRAIDDRRLNAGGGKQRSARRRGGGQGPTPEDDKAPTGRRGRADGTPTDGPRAAGGRTDEARADGPRAGAVRALGGDLEADLLPNPSALGPPEAQTAAALEWAERILRAHAGDGEHSMLRTLLADLPQPRTPWEQVLRTRLARSLAAKTDISWSRPTRSYLANQGRMGPHRRLPFEPGVSPTKSAPRLVVVVDVSGSIADELLESFAAEIEAITRRQRAGLVLVIGDDQVREVLNFEPGRSNLRDIQFSGGGGTDFTPLLLEADRHRPDIAVVLTDLEGPARFRPAWPVIWAVPEAHRRARAPFGRLLVMS